MSELQSLLLPTHISAGVIALVGALLALIAEKGKKLHIYSGRVYFWSMLGIFLTALVMSILNNNQFLLLIGVFSFYLALSGMRFAANRTGSPGLIDWLSVSLMMLSGSAMVGSGGYFYFEYGALDIPLFVFGALALWIGYRDLQTYKAEAAKGKERIVKHLIGMIGGTISVVTAVLVVNVTFQPGWVLWLLPTAIGTPAIIWWSRKVRG